MQGWSVVAVADQARKARLAVLSDRQQHIMDAPLLLVWLADLSRIRRVAEARSISLDALPFLDTFLMAVIDAAIAAQNAAIAFEAVGLGICYIGGIRNDVLAVANELRLPLGAMPLFGMTVGYPDPATARKVKPRLPIETVLKFETYDIAKEDAAIAVYDEAVKSFFAEQGRGHPAWSDQLCDRLSRPSSLRGRERLRGALTMLGFDLG